MQTFQSNSTPEKSPSVKAVFFDIDGTLVSFTTHTVPDSTQKAIKALQEKGIKVIIATGRSITAIDHIRYLNFDGFITFNGGCCVGPDGSVLFRKAIDPNDIQTLLDYTEHNPLSFSLMYENSVSINDVTPEVAGMYAHLNLPVPPLVHREHTDITGVLQANIFLSPEDEVAFMPKVMPNCVASRWTPLFADVNPIGQSKQVGIDVFCQYFGIDVSETMSFGDGGNDITMLKYTGIGVAMGNANENVKEIADYITEDVDNDGVFKALVHFKVI
ncbi:Cof-type HAD-IIB family hydrolase [Cytophagaceae bacterium DM2B3-1]|uniref:Cof-type HAD-IIB family hydrolase n=1 Tax=Xanthocytophaga flava TaxID=3048013 RepID=A0ABT7CQ69_9BACT|nr:Cof-type HAD-IIB family hydrolase [Xanthocytophaga flavus]MDJ1467303.1 Cof-type HAD-IIB family hydrolase [Xanthocytophaga flavus]MDJ1494814.1 Cof-type HAD-IIB family hydrolase [Xanthocytophaga flavus]